MNKWRKKVLILDGGSSQGMPIMQSLFKSGHTIITVCQNKLCSGYFSRYTHVKLIWPHLYIDENATLKELISYLKNNNIDLVLGLGDKTSHMLSKNKEQIESFTKTIVPDYEVYSLAADKFQTMKFCMANDISCPYTLDGESIDVNEIERLIRFPVIVKPKVGVGSVGVKKYQKPESLKKEFERLRNEYGQLLIQEFIPNEEQYTVEAFCDSESKIKACIVVAKVRFFPVSGGTSSCNITVDKPEIILIVKKFLEKIKWIGNANIDIIYDKRDDTPKIIEINPRVGAMVKIAFKSGIDIANLQYQLAFESKVSEFNDYQKEIILRNMFLEIPWLLSTKYKSILSSKPSFFTLWGKGIYYQNSCMADPFIFLGYFLSNLRKYLNPKVFKEKFLRNN